MSQAAAVAHDDHHYTSTGLNSWKVGFWTFIGSECLFFGTLISTYMVYKGQSLVGPYSGDFFDIPLTTIRTFVLLMSSLAMVLALDGVQRGNKKLSLIWLGVVIVLGATFLGFQVYEFNHFYHVGLSLDTNLLGSSFYVLTGFHGAHVAVGVVLLLATAFMSFAGRFRPTEGMNVELVGLYWHFVDIVWIAIFRIVYLLQV